MEIFAESKLRFVRIFSPTIWKRCLLPPLQIQSPPPPPPPQKKEIINFQIFCFLRRSLHLCVVHLDKPTQGKGERKQFIIANKIYFEAALST